MLTNSSLRIKLGLSVGWCTYFKISHENVMTKAINDSAEENLQINRRGQHWGTAFATAATFGGTISGKCLGLGILYLFPVLRQH